MAATATGGVLLLVEDDDSIGRLVKAYLEQQDGWRVVWLRSGEEAVAELRRHPVRLVVLDIGLPGIDGFEVSRRLRSAGVWSPVLMLTARDAVDDRVAGLDSGADDYLVKPFAYEELLARVRALLRRRAPRARRTLRYADVVMDLATREVRRADQPITTTAKEFDLLQHFMRNPGQVLRREQLLDAVWGFDFGASSNVVDVYVGYLRQKLEQGGRPRLLQTVRGVGYILKEE